MRVSLLSCSCLPLLLTLCQPLQAQDLGWRLAAGDEFSYRYTWRLERTQEIKDKLPPTTEAYEIAYTVAHTVSQLDEGGVASLDATISRVTCRLTLGMLGSELFYDSHEDDEMNPLRLIRHLQGQKFSYKLSSRGKVSETTGGDAEREAVQKAAEKEMEAGGGMGLGGPVVSQFSMLFGDASLENSLQIVHEVLPDDGQAQEWSRPIALGVPSLGTMRYQADYKRTLSGEDQHEITSQPGTEIELERSEGPEGDDPMAQAARELQEELGAQDYKVTHRAASSKATFSSAEGCLLGSEVTIEFNTVGPPTPLLQMMLGDDAEGIQMSQQVGIKLLFERSN